MIRGKIKFPEFKGISCNMMPFIQGDSSSLPEKYKSYSDIIDSNYLEKGKVGYLTIDEKVVKANNSQRGYNSKGVDRNVHIEVGRFKWDEKLNNRWGSGTGNRWGGHANVLLDDNTKVLISNSIDDTCRYWDVIEKALTPDGDLSEYLDKYPIESGILMKSGDLAEISIFTPHECVVQTKTQERQFFRIVGDGVSGREDYFTINPKVII